jgi:hypothetical protein
LTILFYSIIICFNNGKIKKSSYPERWRDWPFEASATGSLNTVPIPSNTSGLKDKERVL